MRSARRPPIGMVSAMPRADGVSVTPTRSALEAAQRLELQRDEHKARELRDREAPDHRHREAEHGLAEDPHLDERVFDAQRPQRERREQRRADGHRPHELARSPSPRRRLRQREQHEHEARRRDDESDGIEAAVLAVADVTEEAHRERCAHRADRHVDQEEPAPRRDGGEIPAEHRSEGGSGHRRDPPDAERAPPFVRLEELVDHRHRERHERATPEALQNPVHHEEPEVRRGRAQRRTGGEQREAYDEDDLAPEPVGEPSGRHHRDADGQQVRGDDPFDARQRAEVGADLRQRDVHDRRVEDDHERADEHDRHRDPAVAVVVLRGRAGRGQGGGACRLPTRSGPEIGHRLVQCKSLFDCSRFDYLGVSVACCNQVYLSVSYP